MLPVGRVLQESLHVSEVLPGTGHSSALPRRFDNLLVLFTDGRTGRGLLGAARLLVLAVILPVDLQSLVRSHIPTQHVTAHLVNEISFHVLQLVVPSGRVRTGLVRILQAGVQLRPGLGLGGDEDNLELAALRHDLLLVDHNVAVVVGLDDLALHPRVCLLEVYPGAVQVAEVQTGGALGSLPAVCRPVQIVLNASDTGALAGADRSPAHTGGSSSSGINISCKLSRILVVAC